MLVFLPGAREIQHLQEQALQDEAIRSEFELLLLYGDLSDEEQQRIFTPSEQRRIIFSTNIAETSLTLPRVRVVVDSGFERSMRFVAHAGVGRLELKQISVASAMQRAGRAGRVAEGHCYRLWSEQQQQSFQPTIVPQVHYSELTAMALELAQWGVHQPEQLLWLTPPNAGHWQQAQQQLRWLGAIDDKGAISAVGRRMHAVGLSPKLAHLLVLAADENDAVLALACLTAALLDAGTKGSVDFSRKLDALIRSPSGSQKALHQQAHHWFKRVGGKNWPRQIDTSGLNELLLKAFPDRVARLRQGQQYATSDGIGVQLPLDDALTGCHWLLVLNHELSEHHADAWIRDALLVDRETIDRILAEHIRLQPKVYWDDQKQKVMAEQQTRLGQLVLAKQPIARPDPELFAQALLAAVRKKGLQTLPWNDAAHSLCQRCQLLAQWQINTDWPDLSDAGLMASLDSWLLPYLAGMRSLAEIKELNLVQLLQTHLGYQHCLQLQAWLPTHFESPLGRQIAIEYNAKTGGKVSLPLTEMYGFNQKVHLANGHCVLAFELLSPAGRPLQLTQDLPQFWQGSYREIQKEMKGRYPRHFWPDEPAMSQPTRHTKRRMGI